MKWNVNEVMYNSQAQKEFAKLFKDTFGKGVVCGTCPGNLYKDYFKLKNYLSLTPNEQDMQSTKNFVLNTGALISFKGVTYSEKYLPEAACIEMLLARPELLKKFKVVNEELLKETPKVEEPKESSYSEMKLAALKEEAAKRGLEVSGTSKAVFIEALEADDNKEE